MQTMGKDVERCRGTSQFLDIRVKNLDGEMVDDITRRPSSHSGRSVRMGLEATPNAGNTPTIEDVTPDDVAGMSSKKLARRGGEVTRNKRENQGGFISNKGPKIDDLAEAVRLEENDVVIYSTDVSEVEGDHSFGDVNPRIDDAVRDPKFEVDEFSLSCEQSRKVAGDKVILEDDLVHRVVSMDSENDEPVSLDELREEEAYADEQDAFDYDTTNKDHQDSRR
jgi:hypothetical protein